MACLQAQNVSSLPSPALILSRRLFRASLRAPNNLQVRGLSLLKLAATSNMQELSLIEERTHTKSSQQHTMIPGCREENLVIKLYAIAEAAADRAEMHAIIGKQRNNWNILLLNSTTSITLTASIMAGIAAFPVGGVTPCRLAFKLSSALLYTVATGMMLVINKIQPSQLAEEQRNATRLFRQLEKSIYTTLALRAPTKMDVEEAMERVLAIDKAYPLSLLPGMLEKFPKIVEPATWWPKLQQRRRQMGKNGWSKGLEEEMRGILKVIKVKDEEEYVRSGKMVLNINRILAVLGPLFTGIAALGSVLIGFPVLGHWPVLMGVAGGALATVLNTLEHGGQVGMLFELFRNCAGFYRQLNEVIESNLEEGEVEKREEADLFEMKVALQLGRRLSELKGFASYASPSYRDGEHVSEFAGKLF